MRRSHRLIWGAYMLLVSVLFCACTTPSGIGQSALDSGITGITEAGPQCPVVTPANPCPPKPVSRTVMVYDRQGNEVIRFTSAHDGTFHVPISPGNYTLTAVVTLSGSPPTLTPVKVTVLPHQFTHIDVLFDTGIR